MKTSFKVLMNVLLAFAVSVGVSAAGASVGVGVDPINVMGAVLGLGALSSVGTLLFGRAAFGAGMALMVGVQVEIWQDVIMENLFKDNSFLNYSVDVSGKVLGGKVVHIPQSGSGPAVEKNRTLYPAVAVQRTDTDVTYTLDEYSTDPTHIPDIEQAEISYDKRNSVYADHFGEISDAIADDILYKWSTSTSANIVRTTGSLVATNLAPSATGTRRKLLKEDLKAMRGILTKHKVKGKFIALVPTDQFQELLDDSVFAQENAHIQREADPTKARIAGWAGMIIFERTETTIYDSSLAPKAPGAAAAATDHQAVICWVDSAVEKAVGAIKFYENIGDALYYGDVYSAAVRSGGRIRRGDAKGVGAIVQAAS